MNVEELKALGLDEALAKKAAEASKKELEGFIPKTRFEEVNTAKKQLEKDMTERDVQLETLKKNNGDSEALQKQIDALQADNKQKDEDYQKQLKNLSISNAIKLAIADKARDADLVAGLVDTTKLILGEDGTVTGLNEQIETLQKDKEFLFKPKQKENTPPAGFKLGGDGNPNPPTQAGNVSIKEALEAHYKQA